MDQKAFDELTIGCFENRLFSYMKTVGINRIELEYSGGGDSGGVDGISFIPSEVSESIKNGLRNDIEEPLATPIYNRHGGFADGGGFHVNGMVSYDANNKDVWISGTDYITEYGDENEDGEYEEDSREEEWEECLFDGENSSKEIDCQFAYLYARDVIKGKFEEEFHNKMVAYAAIHQDEYAEQYLKEIKN